MQETRPSDMAEETARRLGKLRQEYFVDKTDEAVAAQMDERLTELESKGETLVRRVKIGRNDPCPCNSGRKFKKCCIHKARA